MEKQNYQSRIVVLMVVLIISACCKKSAAPARDYNAEGYKSARIVKPEVAGCDYGFLIENIKYQPLNMPDSLRKDGTLVWLKYHIEKNRMSTCMSGELITIEQIEYRK